MDISSFIRTVYLGDRSCKSVTIDGWNSTVRVQVDCISRVRDPSGNWNFYGDEDINDGVLVFTEVEAIELRGGGYVPNDQINSIEVVEPVGEAVIVELSVDSVDRDAVHHETILRVTCRGLHLEDPGRPGLQICK